MRLFLDATEFSKSSLLQDEVAAFCSASWSPFSLAKSWKDRYFVGRSGSRLDVLNRRLLSQPGILDMKPTCSSTNHFRNRSLASGVSLRVTSVVTATRPSASSSVNFSTGINSGDSSTWTKS